jgi:hypothetical protein
MNKLLKLIFICIAIFWALPLYCQDTIMFSINMAKYEKIAKENMKNAITDIRSAVYGKYTENELTVFSIPAFEWNQKAKDFTCESREKLENLISFAENPYFQMIFFVDNRKNIVGGFDLSVSQTRTERRIKDSINWVSQIPNTPFSPFSSNPFPYYEIKDLKTVYKFHLKHPDAFIFRIADIEGFWVVKNNQLCRLEGNTIKSANQYLYMYGEEYIRDIANGTFRTGYQYLACFNNKTIRFLSKQHNNIFIEIIDN